MKGPATFKSTVSVLVVDDVPEMAELLKHTVDEAHGITVIGVAHSGLEAERSVAKQRPDLVILDRLLPGESSLELGARLESQGIRILWTSATAISDKVENSLPKPSWETISQDRPAYIRYIRAIRW